jgi:hypothetical protein
MPALTPANDLLRAVNVTASEVGALLDPHPYTSPQRIYDRITGHPEYVPPDHTESMALGVWFEDRIARYTAHKLGMRLRANTRTRVHPYVLLAATPDYIVLKSRFLVECKLSSIMYGWSEDKLAPHIEWQARAQLACTDREVCFIAALVGSQFYTIPVVREADAERRMLQAVNDFEAAHLIPRVRPAPPEIPQLRKVKVEPSRG